MIFMLLGSICASGLSDPRKNNKDMDGCWKLWIPFSIFWRLLVLKLQISESLQYCFLLSIWKLLINYLIENYFSIKNWKQSSLYHRCYNITKLNEV